MKEKRIVEAIVKNQEALFKYKKYIKTLPDEITKDMVDDLGYQSIKAFHESRKMLTEIIHLMSTLDKDFPMIEDLRELDRLNGVVDGMIMSMELMRKQRGKSND